MNNIDIMNEIVNIFILIVEDDKYMNEILYDLLNSDISKVDSSYTALDAINKLSEDDKKYQLVILDYNLGNMKGITGLDVYDIVKVKNPKVKSIMITGHATREIKKQAIAEGINVFIEKPFSITELLNSVHDMIDNIIVEELQERKKPNTQLRKD